MSERRVAPRVPIYYKSTSLHRFVAGAHASAASAVSSDSVPAAAFAFAAAAAPTEVHADQQQQQNEAQLEDVASTRTPSPEPAPTPDAEDDEDDYLPHPTWLFSFPSHYTENRKILLHECHARINAWCLSQCEKIVAIFDANPDLHESIITCVIGRVTLEKALQAEINCLAAYYSFAAVYVDSEEESAYNFELPDVATHFTTVREGNPVVLMPHNALFP